MRQLHRSLLNAIAAAAALATLAPAQAADRNWVCPGENSFNVGTCWANGLGPVTNDNANFLIGAGLSGVGIYFPGTNPSSMQLNLNKVTLDGGNPSAPVMLVVNGGRLNAATAIVGTDHGASMLLTPSNYPNATFYAGTLQLGLNAGSTGTVRVNGASSELLADTLQVGVAGTGQMLVTGGVVTAGNVQLSAPSSISVSSGRFSSTGTFTNSGSFGVDSGSVSAPAQLIANNVVNSGQFYLQNTAGTTTADIKSFSNQSGAYLQVVAVTSIGTLNNSAGGNVLIANTHGGMLTTNTFNNGGLLTVSSNTTLRANSGLLNQASGNLATYQGSKLYNFNENRGVFNLNGDTTVDNSGSGQRLFSTGTINMGGKTLTVNPGFDNAGTLTGSGTLDAVVWNRSLGRIVVADQQSLAVTQGLLNDGTIELNGTDGGGGPRAWLKSANLVNQGVIKGTGFITGPVYNDGQISGSLIFVNSYTASATSVQTSVGGLYFYGGASFESGGTVGGSMALFRDHLDVGLDGTAGLLTAEGQVWLAGAGYTADIFDTQLGKGYDHLTAGSMLITDGAVLHMNSGSFVLQAGQTYDLFDFGTVSGTFSSIDTSNLKLAAGTHLDTSRLYIDGTISVTAVPEPSTWALMASGLLWVWRRQRALREAA